MTFGKRHPEQSRVWFHTEPQMYEKARGQRVWLRIGRLTFHCELDYIARREWGFYFNVHRRGFDWIRVQIGPGTIPF